jgi:hypothetical protein
MDDLSISDHALEQMQRDSLTEDDVYIVVGDYDERIEQVGGRTEYARDLDDGRHIVVIEGDEQTVVTVWWDKRRSRRGRQ